MTQAQLTPEQRTALETLHSRMAHWHQLRVDTIPVHSMLQEGYFAFSHQPFERLPHGDTWTWNKSGGKAQVRFEDGTLVSLYKMNARRKSTAFKAPHLKIWIYSISMLNNAPHIFGYWCENGIRETKPEELKPEPRLEDYAFLAPHVDPCVALEFGWI